MALTSQKLEKILRRRPTRLDPEVRRRLAPVVKALTGKDVVQRQRAVAGVLKLGIRSVREWLLDRLIACLRRRSASSCQPALDSLVELGDLAVPALCDAVTADANPVVQARAI